MDSILTEVWSQQVNRAGSSFTHTLTHMVTTKEVFLMSRIEKLFMAFTVVVCSIMFFVFCGSDATGSDGVSQETTCEKKCASVNLEECICSEETDRGRETSNLEISQTRGYPSISSSLIPASDMKFPVCLNQSF